MHSRLPRQIDQGTPITQQEATAIQSDKDSSPLATIGSQFRHSWPSIDAISVELFLSLSYTARFANEALNEYVEAHDLGQAQSSYTVLRALFFAPHHEMPQHEIGRTLGVARMTVSKRVDALEAAGFVGRRTNPDDRRVTLVRLTPSGEQFTQRLLPVVGDFMTHLWAGFSIQEKELLRELLRRTWLSAQEFDSLPPEA